MTKLDKTTAAELDDEISRMTEDEKNELSTTGGRILKRMDTPEGKAKLAEYMRKYKARIALAAARGLYKEEQR